MSGLFGGGKSQSTTDQRYNALQLTQSSYGQPIPWVRGRTRIPGNLIWYNDFTATKHSDSVGGGKGGGGGGGSTTSYTYSAAMMLVLGEGIMNAVNAVYADKAQHTLADLGLTFFNGATGQAVWSYLTTNHPSQAVPNSDTAYVAGILQLGASAGLPNLTFEADCGLAYNLGGGIFDAEASDLIIDYLTDAKHGAQFAHLGSIQGAGNTYQGWCIANGFFFSPNESTQRAAADWLREMLQITNANCVNSAGTLNIIPYADAAVTGNSRTYTPNLTPLFSFNDGDYCPQAGEDPVMIELVSQKKTFNVVNVEFLDRANAYNPAIACATDRLDVGASGRRVMNTLSFHQITSGPLARLIAQLILQRQLYIRRSFTCRVRADYSGLEGMDLISLTDSNTGLVNQLARITRTEDAEDDYFTITAEEVPIGPASAPLYSWQANAGFAQNYAAAPGNVQTPLFFMMPPLLVDSANGGYQIAIGLAGSTSLWGGCDVFWSLDNVTYQRLARHTGSSRYGALTASFATGSDPDTANALQVQLANTADVMAGASQADADNLRTLMWVDGELVSYEYCTLTAPGAYTFTSTGAVGGTKYMRRGKYGSPIATHALGSKFARIDQDLFRLPIDPGLIGQTIYFKFCSVNIYGGGLQDISAATAYSYTPTSTNIGQSIPGQASLIARGACVLTGDRIFKSGVSSAWDADCYSMEAYSAGCALTFRAADNSPSVFMMGLNSDPTLDQSYTSLDFAWYLAGNNGGVGRLLIYESGVSMVDFGAGQYTSANVFSITYDGAVVRYYRDGIVMREISAPGKVLAFDSSFSAPGSTALDVDFTPLISAPASRLIARGNCIVVGNSIQKPTGVNGWDSDCYSTEAFAQGVAVSFRLGAGHCMMGLNSDPTTDQSYTSLDYAWEADIAGNLWTWTQAGATNPLVATNLTSADVLSIRYDGQWVRWYRNNVLIREFYDPGKTLSVDSSFYAVGTLALDVNFGPLTIATPSPFLARGNCVISDTHLQKVGGSSAWDSDVYSIVGYPIAHLSFKAIVLSHQFMIGFNSDPTLDSSYTSLDFAFFLAAGTLEIYESGALVQTVGSYVQTDVFSMIYDGAHVLYFYNDQLVRTSAATGTLFFDSSFFTPGAQAWMVEYGPGTLQSRQDTFNIGQNAASQIASNTVSGSHTVGLLLASFTDTDLVSVTATTTGLPIGVDVTADCSVGNTNNNFVSVCLVTIRRDGVDVGTAQFDCASAWTNNLHSSGTWQGPVTLTIIDTPSAGSHTYTMHMHGGEGGTAGSGFFTYVNPSIKLREYKR